MYEYACKRVCVCDGVNGDESNVTANDTMYFGDDVIGAHLHWPDELINSNGHMAACGLRVRLFYSDSN